MNKSYSRDTPHRTLQYEERYEERADEQIERDLYKSRLEDIHTKHYKTSGYFFDEDDWTACLVDGLTNL